MARSRRARKSDHTPEHQRRFIGEIIGNAADGETAARDWYRLLVGADRPRSPSNPHDENRARQLLQIVYPDNPGHVEDELAQMASDYFDLEDKHCWGPDWEYLFETLAARCGIKPAAARKMTWTEIAEALKAACQRTAISGRIPPERRTIPMSKHDAARLMGYTRPDEYGRNRRSTKDAVALLTKSMQDGIIKAEQQSRQRYVFDREDFPKEVHHKIIPSLNRSSP